MSAAPFTQPWLDERVARLGALPEVPGATARLLHVVTGGPDGEVRYTEAYVDGRLTAAALGNPAEPADLELACPHEVAVQVATGALSEQAGFMQGRIKVVGPMGPYLALLDAVARPEHRAALAELAAATTT